MNGKTCVVAVSFLLLFLVVPQGIGSQSWQGPKETGYIHAGEAKEWRMDLWNDELWIKGEAWTPDTQIVCFVLSEINYYQYKANGGDLRTYPSSFFIYSSQFDFHVYINVCPLSSGTFYVVLLSPNNSTNYEINIWYELRDNWGSDIIIDVHGGILIHWKLLYYNEAARHVLVDYRSYVNKYGPVEGPNKFLYETKVKLNNLGFQLIDSSWKLTVDETAPTLTLEGDIQHVAEQIGQNPPTYKISISKVLSPFEVRYKLSAANLSGNKFTVNWWDVYNEPTVDFKFGTITINFDQTCSNIQVEGEALTYESSGCLIATATYGSELSPEVQFLRNFRDREVMQTLAGSSFMAVFNAWYYWFSPTVARVVASNLILRDMMKAILYPLIGALRTSSYVYSLLGFNREIAVVTSGFVASSMIGFIYLWPFSAASQAS